MAKYIRESEMEIPVKTWMKEQGYYVHRQSALPDNSVPDLLGYCIARDVFLAVELKMYNYSKALSQALDYREYCHLAYIAYPAKRAEKVFCKYGEKLKSHGIGLLAVEPERVMCLLNAAINKEAVCEKLYKRFKKEISWKCVRCGRCCMHMNSDDTGMPCEWLLVKDGMATCLIHDNKPDVCRNYPNHPDFGEPCFFNK